MIIVAGQILPLQRLTAEMDEAFIDLFTAFFGSGAADWTKFETAAAKFFAEPST
jgi:hypothetical protein